MHKNNVYKVQSSLGNFSALEPFDPQTVFFKFRSQNLKFLFEMILQKLNEKIRIEAKAIESEIRAYFCIIIHIEHIFKY